MDRGFQLNLQAIRRQLAATKTTHPLSAILGLVGLAVSVFAIIDNRRQRDARERAVIAARETLERIYGLIVGLKAAATSQAATAAMNDGLEAINQQRSTLDSL